MSTKQRRAISVMRRERLLIGKRQRPMWLDTVLYFICHAHKFVELTGSVVLSLCILSVVSIIAMASNVSFVEESESVADDSNVVIDSSTFRAFVPVINVRPEDYYMSSTTHTQLTAEISSYNVAVGVYGHEATIYGTIQEDMYPDEKVTLLQGESVTLTPRAGYSVEVTNTETDVPENGGVYQDDLAICSITRIDVDVEQCGYFTINGRNIMRSTTLENINNTFGISLSPSDSGYYRYNNDYVELSFRWNENNELSEFSVNAASVIPVDDAYPVLLPDRSVTKPESISLTTESLNSLRNADINNAPVIVNGYSLGNWTTQEQVLAAFGGEIIDNSLSYNVGSNIVTFLFDNTYLSDIVID